MNILRCPICYDSLNKNINIKSYSCKNGHAFDIAKQGYINLLMSNDKKSKEPGDNKEMILSRNFFLDQNYYKKISNCLNSMILKNLAKKHNINILDIGCGGGYYTSLLKRELTKKNRVAYVLGIDISKNGIIEAAKTDKTIKWIVASGSKLPIIDNSLDFVICMFSYINFVEYKRVLKKSGKLIVVSTGEYHLVELKKILYNNLKMDYYKPYKDLKEGYLHKKLENLQYKTILKNSEDIKNLFNMTPYKWTSPKEGIEKVLKLSNLEISVDVNISVFEKI